FLFMWVFSSFSMARMVLPSIPEPDATGDGRSCSSRRSEGAWHMALTGHALQNMRVLSCRLPLLSTVVGLSTYGTTPQQPRLFHRPLPIVHRSCLLHSGLTSHAGFRIQVRGRPAQRPQLQHAHVVGRQTQFPADLPGAVAVQE